MAFKSIEEFEAHVIKKCKNAIAKVEKEVYDTVESNRNAFYGEDWAGRIYDRTNALHDSLKRTGVNELYAEIYFDTPSYNTGTWSGEKVLSVAMEGEKPHGGYMEGTQIWTASMNELGDIKAKTAQALMSQGIPIVK